MKLSTRDEPLGEGSCALSAHPLACAGCWVSQGLSQEAPETGCGQACPCPLHIIPGTEVGTSDGIKGITDCPDFSLAGGACIPYPCPLPPCPHSGVTLRPSRVVETKKGGKEVSERLTEVWDRGQFPSHPGDGWEAGGPAGGPDASLLCPACAQ